MPFRVHVCCPVQGLQTNPVGRACSMCRLLSHDACAFQRAFLHLHVSSRVWASRCMSESAVLPRFSATQNHACPFHPVTQTQSPCTLIQVLVSLTPSPLSAFRMHVCCAARDSQSRRPHLQYVLTWSPVIRARACSTLQASRHAACTTRNTA